MTAQLLEYTSPSDVLVRRVQAARAASVRATVAPHREGNVIHASWGATQARACDVSRPAEVVPAPAVAPVAAAPAARLVWTERWIAVMVSLVALVFGVMLTTVVGAFLSVSNAPLVALVGG